MAQAPPPPPAPGMAGQPPLQEGPCLDSARGVPQVLQKPLSRGMQIVRIDQVLSTATMMPGNVIGFLYTTENGATWLGERSADYMSPAAATAINTVLAATHVAAKNITSFPPQSRYGVATKYPQFFAVRIPPDAFGALRITLAPCTVWPAGRALPDPSM
ncbi:MAG: hypothetical protein JO003_12485 [Candidatus Eremiobacteraeota bacterium]|nr:hypothetical protein [Candidatus Eremiobacteraeota bacterium]